MNKPVEMPLVADASPVIGVAYPHASAHLHVLPAHAGNTRPRTWRRSGSTVRCGARGVVLAVAPGPGTPQDGFWPNLAPR